MDPDTSVNSAAGYWPGSANPVSVVAVPVVRSPSRILPLVGVFTINTGPLNAEAVVANDAGAGVKVIDVAALEVVANELDITLLAQLLVPNSEPVIPRDTFNDPVSCVLPDTISPFRAINSFAIIIPNKNVQ